MVKIAFLTVLFSAVAACGGGGENSGDFTDPQCNDGQDNDEDGAVDFPDDPGCTATSDTSEESEPSAQCQDGRDNDGDNLTDYPLDPGCPVPQADSEEDDCPDGPLCPQCADGEDNDQNGSMDYPGDPGCMAAGDDVEHLTNPAACGSTISIRPLPATGMVSEDTIAPTSLSTLSSPCGGGGGSPAYAYELNLTSNKVVEVSTDGSTMDTIIDIRREDCDAADSEVTCNDDVTESSTSSHVLVALDAGIYYIIVGGRDSSATGSVELRVTLFAGEGEPCSMTSDCGQGLFCRVPLGGSTMSCEQPQCADGVDDDSDGKDDFPTDPGCLSSVDNDELDDCPSGPNCPQCSDGQDNDTDGQTDYPNDTTCVAASSPVEQFCATETDPTANITTNPITGTTVGLTNNFASTTCQSSASGSDRAFSLAVPVTLTTLTINTDTSSFDTIIQVKDSTCATAIACDDDGGNGTQSNLVMSNVAPGTYAILLDGYSGASGTYTMTVRGVAAVGQACTSPLFSGGANAILTCPTSCTANVCQ